MELELLTARVSDICRSAGQYIEGEQAGHSDLELEEKGKHNYVTRVDKQAEEMIISGLKELLPQAGVLAEEGTGNEKNSDLRWIIDPLDGTTNFIHGIPFYSVSIALEVEGKLVLGVICDVVRKECFTAWEGGPSALNGEKIRVSATKDLSGSLVATGFPYDHGSKLNNYLSLFSDVVHHSRGLRRLGSAALDLAYTACGRFDGFYEMNLNPWDVAAGIVIVRQAGGMVTDFLGSSDYTSGKTIIASNGMIHEQLLHLTGKHFRPK